MKRRDVFLTFLFFCYLSLNSQQAISQTVTYFPTGEEFSGPLPGWKNIKTDFGAKGDGITDDAPAITAALYAFRDMDNINCSVLYFPAGIYRIGSTIFNADRGEGGYHYAGLAIIGEDPSNTVLLWDGPDQGTMFKLDGWWLKVSRITFDGQNKAKTGILRDGGFGTAVEYSDLVFKDVFWGVLLGGESGMGQAENLFLRNKFYNCDCGIYGPNMNSLDIWLWYCLFQDCSYGVNCGGYQAYNNVFLRSKVVDIGLSWQPSCVVNNISVNTKCFTKGFQNAGFFQGNKIYDPDTTIIRNDWYILDTLKAFTVPYVSVLLDNLVRTRGNSGAAIELSGGKCLSVGNTFTQQWPVRPGYQSFTRNSRNPVLYAVDGNLDTYFVGGLWQSKAGVAWHCPSGTAKTAVKYSITASTTVDRDWDLKDFRLVGSNDWGYNVTVLDSQINQSWVPGETKTFTLQNSIPYSIYRLEILKNNKGEKPGDGEYFTLAEFTLTNEEGINLMSEAGGFVAGVDETWGKYYSIGEQKVPYESIPFPEIIQLPGTPPLVSHKVFEVRQGTADDATEIQSKIDSATRELIGTRPIVHIPKGIYYIKKTLILPANVEMTICGDGLWNGGTQIIGDLTLFGPTFKIAAPSHLLVRDIEIQGNEAIYAEVDDQPGSRVTGTLFQFGGWDLYNMSYTAMIIDGIEQSYMLFTGALLGSCYNGVLVKGGPTLSSGGETEGQIAFLGGASSFGQNLWETQKNGRIIAQGMWYEAELGRTKNLIDLTSASSGSLAIGGMYWGYAPDTDRPIVSIDNFSGQFTAVANNFGGSVKPQWWQMTGNGASEQILSAGNIWSLGSDSAAMAAKWPYWSDQTSPSATASRLFCEGTPEITNKIINTLPDSASVLSSLSLMRSLRIKKPEVPMEKDSHLDFIRVIAFSSGGTAVRFVANKGQNDLPEQPVLISPSNNSTDIEISPIMNWKASAGASSYHIQLSQNAAFDAVVFEDSTITVTSYEITPLINNCTYFWRVRAKNTHGKSTWSLGWSFTTGIKTSVEKIRGEILPEYNLSDNYPNPFSLTTSIEYSVSSKVHVIIVLFDYSGKEIATLVNVEQIPGKYEFKFNRTDLPEGIYFYRMVAGDYSKTRKMVILR